MPIVEGTTVIEAAVPQSVHSWSVASHVQPLVQTELVLNL